MERGTVLARVQSTVELTPLARSWFRMYSNTWFAQNDGNDFLREYGRNWTQIVASVVNEEVTRYFLELGVPEDVLPRVEVGDTYIGSFIIDLFVVAPIVATNAFGILKGVAELPKIADGLIDLHDILVNKTQEQLQQEAKQQVQHLLESVRREGSQGHQYRPLPPELPLVSVDYVIDARPLRSLSEASAVSHKVHLSVAVSRAALTLENLGDEDIRDVRIGLFKSATERNQWSYGEAFSSSVSILSARQTVTRACGGFRNQHHEAFDLSDGQAVYVDCWVQDKHGIYLFNFFLDGSLGYKSYPWA